MIRKNLILIMARSGSDDAISRQNLRLVNGKPLIYYIIKTALKFKNASVVVSSDSDEIKELSKMFGAQVIHRPKKLTRNNTSIKEICLDALKKLNYDNQNFEYCLVLHPKIPLIKLKTINTFFKMSRENRGTFFGISNIIDPKHAYKINNVDKFFRLESNKYKIGLLNKIVCFKIKSFLKNNGKFDVPFSGINLSQSETLALTTYNEFGIFEKILSKRKILVRIDASKFIGMGHVYNILSILNHFRNDEILIVMHKKFNLGSKKFREHLYDVKLFSSLSELEKIIEKFKPDMIFNDILNTKVSYMRKLGTHDCFIVNFEDLGEGRKFANLVFNPIFKSKKILPHEFYGGKYACVRDEFRLFKNSILQKIPKKVVISFGGTDQNNLTVKTIDIIKKYNIKNIEFTIILGYGFSTTSKIKEKISNLNNDGFRFNLIINSDFLAKHVRDADFSIISNGRTAFEFAAMCVPLISISVNSREKSHSFVKDEKIGFHFNYEDSSFEKLIIQGINKMLLYRNRKLFKNRLEKLDLLQGIDNVVSIINSKYDQQFNLKKPN